MQVVVDVQNIIREASLSEYKRYNGNCVLADAERIVDVGR
jgi:hypothetical protein